VRLVLLSFQTKVTPLVAALASVAGIGTRQVPPVCLLVGNGREFWKNG